MSNEPELFSPLHIEHIAKYLPIVRTFLALPPGYRFEIDDKGYEGVWFDPRLLDA